MGVAEIGIENTTAVVATDIATVEAGTVIATGTGIGNTAATNTNADAVAKIETKTAAADTATVREKKEITESDEGRGKTMWRILLMRREKKAKMGLMFRAAPIPKTRKEGTQDTGRTTATLARSRVSLRNDLLRALRGEFSVDTWQAMSDQVFYSAPSPAFEQPQDDYNPEEPKDDDSETRSAFVSQLAARLTARDLGYFFEDKLGEGTVLDSRIVTDRISRRSKGYGLFSTRARDLAHAIPVSATWSFEQ